MNKYFLTIFFKIFTPFIIVFSIYVFISYNTSIKNIEKSYREILKNYWILISKLNIEDEKHIENLLQPVKDNDIRISLINKNGKVILDSAINNNELHQMDNHINRKEVEMAIQGYEYYDIRKSATTGRYSIYYAKEYKNNYILRIISDGAIFHNLYSKTKKDIIIFFTIFFILIILITHYISYKISLPVIELSKTVKAINNKEDNYILPYIHDKVMNDTASIIYNINKQLLKEQECLVTERSILSNLINYIDESVILCNEKGEVIKVNDVCSILFNSKIVEHNHILENIKDYDTSVFFSQILEKYSGSFKNILHEKVYEINVKELNSYKLIIIRDITAESDYNDFKAELTANIAHEIKTPVAIIMAASETLINDDNMPKELSYKFLNKINNGSKRLNNIINQILELYKMENTGLYIEEKTVIKNIVDNLLIKESNKNVVIKNLSTKEYEIDSFHVEMILTNLINNAIKYSTGKNIDVLIYDEDNKLIIEVADYGPLIDEKERKRIFERFYTVSKSRNNSGFGLGLSIVKHITLLYGGKAYIYANENNGNTFKIEMYGRI